MSRIRVGFIGLNPDSHWASTAHIPALKSLSDEFKVVGVANSTLESAQRTDEALQLKHAFAMPSELVASDEIDLVVVTVKVPYHYELVTAALGAGKHVHCEWPLASRTRSSSMNCSTSSNSRPGVVPERRELVRDFPVPEDCAKF